MFYQHSNGSTTLPRGFRYHHSEDVPTTPEPSTIEEPQQPSPPRPTRLKVKRRNVSSLQAPTEQFLASVAAADVPIPTIEVPQQDSEMPDRESISLLTSGYLSPQMSDFRSISLPKTPVPMLSPMDESNGQRPDWSMGSPSPSEDYFQRPVSSHSNLSDYSDDSFYSGSRISRPSEDGSCTSPESDITDPFHFPSFSKGKGRAISREPVITLNGQIRSKTRKDAPWTKAQSTHLWSTYLVYLQDPTVTPFRIGASTVPPEGVCHRVARQARKSWRGPKSAASSNIRRSARLRAPLSESRETKSGSNTPTQENPKTYAQWPHASSATRNHLRELCKSRSTTAVTRHRHLQSRSPTPFTKKYRLHTPEAPRFSSFNTHDIAFSLTADTAESMRPDGPLAKLASAPSVITPVADCKFPPFEDYKPMGSGEPQEFSKQEVQRARRLGSPFTARTYGPSSSKTITCLDTRPSPPRTQSDSLPGPFLRSPLRFNHHRSLNSTQKRRAVNDLEEELSHSGAVLRPSILDEQLFGTPFNQRRVRSRGFSLGDEALRPRNPSAFTLPPFADLLSKADTSSVDTTGPPAPPSLLPSATFEPPPRLGSPFSGAGPSNTFPRRLFQDGSATIRKSAFATMHQTRRSIESFDFGEGPSLQSRLGLLDRKLKEIREREGAARQQNFE